MKYPGSTGAFQWQEWVALCCRFWPSVFCLYYPLLIVAGLTGFSFKKYFFCEIWNKTNKISAWSISKISLVLFSFLWGFLWVFFSFGLKSVFFSLAFLVLNRIDHWLAFCLILYHHFLILCFIWNLSFLGIKQKLLLAYLDLESVEIITIIKKTYYSQAWLLVAMILVPWIQPNHTPTRLKWKLLNSNSGSIAAVMDKPLMLLPQFPHL